MAQIRTMGAYVPRYRLKRSDVADAWHTVSMPGERAVANLDEDSLTMGVEAALRVLDGADAEEVDALYFASTTPPYRVKQSAAIISHVLGLASDCFTADFSNSTRAGTSALRAAADAVDAGSARAVIVVAADCRAAMPASAEEMLAGDAACALLVTPGDEGLNLRAFRSGAGAVMDQWQRVGDRFVQGSEDRFAKGEGYQRQMKGAVRDLLEKEGLRVEAISKFVFSAPDFRSPAALARALGADPGEALAETFIDSIGNSGAAGVLVSLFAAAVGASPGDRLVVAGYGDGCDALLFEAGPAVNGLCPGPAIDTLLDDKTTISYIDYLRFRELLENQVTDIPEGPSSAPLMLREEKALLRFTAHRCRKCGTMHYPMERVCYNCFSKDDFDEVPMAREPASLFTYTKDNLFQGGDPPLVMAVAESREGCRFYLQMTDRDPEAVTLGMPLRFTFRRLHEGGGFHNYFWKCRPARAADAGGS